MIVDMAPGRELLAAPPPGGGESLATVTVSHRAGFELARVAGEVDMSSAPQVRASILAIVAERGAGLHGLVIDLLRVEFFGAAGLGVLGEVQRRCPEDAEVRIVATAPIVLRMLQLTGLDRLLPVYATIDDACVSR
jgi:anti-anti-sigma factor